MISQKNKFLNLEEKGSSELQNGLIVDGRLGLLPNFSA